MPFGYYYDIPCIIRVPVRVGHLQSTLANQVYVATDLLIQSYYMRLQPSQASSNAEFLYLFWYNAHIDPYGHTYTYPMSTNERLRWLISRLTQVITCILLLADFFLMLRLLCWFNNENQAYSRAQVMLIHCISIKYSYT